MLSFYIPSKVSHSYLIFAIKVEERQLKLLFIPKEKKMAIFPTDKFEFGARNCLSNRAGPNRTLGSMRSSFAFFEPSVICNEVFLALPYSKLCFHGLFRFFVGMFSVHGRRRLVKDRYDIFALLSSSLNQNTFRATQLLFSTLSLSASVSPWPNLLQ